MDNNSIFENIKLAQKDGKKVVFTNGCFDILHIGHLRYLQEAKKLGDFLIIGLNSDSSVKRLKGETRPIVEENERKEMLEGLKPVDLVMIFNEDTPLELIKEVEPNILVKGGDWKIEEIVGSEEVLENGGEVKSLSFIDGKSTSEIISRVLGEG